MSYIGSTPTTQSFISGTDYFNGTGSQTAFTLSRSVASVNDIQATVNNVVQVPNDAYTISGTTITFTSAPSAGTSNIYVRYLSTTTQAITPSQGTVGWSTLDANTQQDLGISFKNRIINGAMVIDQRNAGASVATSGGSNIYTLDRWQALYSQTSKFTVQQNAGSVTPPVGFVNYLGVTSTSAYTVGASELFLIRQRIEGYNIADLGWGTANAKTVTLSFQVYSSLTGTFGGTLNSDSDAQSYPFTYTISSANTWTSISVTIAGPTSGTWLKTNGSGIIVTFGLGVGATYSGTAGSWSSNPYYSATGATSVVGTSGATWYVTGVQLEVGTQATTFDYRSYGTELALCYRYFQSIAYAGNAILSIGLCTSTTVCEATISLLQTMRSTPTVTLPPAGQTTGQISYLTSSGTYPGTTGLNTANNLSVNNFTVSGTSYSASFVLGNAGWLYANGAVTIQASAEL